MVRRSSKSAFMPDVYVFPGGAVAEEDHHIELQPDLCRPIVPTGADPEERTRLGTGLRAAALRELFEEANILLAYTNQQSMLAIEESSLARFQLHRQNFHDQQGSMEQLLRVEQLLLATDQLYYFSHWITPEASPRRYDTHFFLASGPTSQEAAYDQIETTDGIWIGAGQALERYAAGTFDLAFPTIYQLRELAVFTSVAEALSATEQRYVQTHRPVIVKEAGESQIILPEETSQS
ncbi:NUDIX hydrolase [Dictyobacter alpinus]|uniref:NUDIX hydrolase n=2 Tax=Dictyobacter alpinus TaxID=2014873 RepID=A0A402B3N4_9CHLR|nr:NUDIX hydrolase [Dictyobacter alpinus]